MKPRPFNQRVFKAVDHEHFKKFHQNVKAVVAGTTKQNKL